MLFRTSVGSLKGIMHRICSLCGGGASPIAVAGGIERMRKKRWSCSPGARVYLIPILSGGFIAGAFSRKPSYSASRGYK